MLEVGADGQVDSTNPGNWWGGPGPFFRNFPFNVDTGYTKEGFMYTVLGAGASEAGSTASCEIGITASVQGSPTITMGTVSPYASPTITGAMYVSCR